MDVFGYKLVINSNITSEMFFDSAERSTGRRESSLGWRNFFLRSGRCMGVDASYCDGWDEELRKCVRGGAAKLVVLELL